MKIIFLRLKCLEFSYNNVKIIQKPLFIINFFFPREQPINDLFVYCYNLSFACALYYLLDTDTSISCRVYLHYFYIQYV